MYYKTTQILNVYSAFGFYKKNLICNIGNGTKAHLTFFDEALNITQQLEQTSYDFFVYKDSLLFTTQTIIQNKEEKILKSFHLDIENSVMNELSYTLYLKGIQNNDKYLCSGTQGTASDEKEVFYFLIDLNTFKIQKEIPKIASLKRVEFFTLDFILFSNRIKGVVSSYNLVGDNLWQKNLSEETSYIDWDGKLKKDKINCVKSWKNRLVVQTKCFLLCLNTNGKILYKIKFPDLLRAQSLVIVEDKGYIYNYHDYVVVDLEKGNLILHKEIRSFVYQDEQYNNFAQDLTFFEGILYHSVNSSGLSFVVAINPATGDTIWRQHINGQSINSIRFHEDKMFILDGGSTLHIFEKEAKTHNDVI